MIDYATVPLGPPRALQRKWCYYSRSHSLSRAGWLVFRTLDETRCVDVCVCAEARIDSISCCLFSYRGDNARSPSVLLLHRPSAFPHHEEETFFNMYSLLIFFSIGSVLATTGSLRYRMDRWGVSQQGPTTFDHHRLLLHWGPTCPGLMKGDLCPESSIIGQRNSLILM